MPGPNRDLLQLIHASWDTVRPRLQRDSAELERRLLHRARAAAARPPRAWCLAVRANDRRINKVSDLIIPTDAADDDVLHPHTLLLDSDLLRRLCVPIYTHTPGESASKLAARLGTTLENLTTARLNGRFRTHYVLPPGCAGRKIPLLCSDEALDPCAKGFISRDPLWNLTSQFLPDLLPAGFEQTVRRVPAFQPPPRRSDLIEPRPSRRLPPPPPDYAWYKWKDGVYIESAHDKRLARRREKDRAHRRLHPRPSRYSGSLRFARWKFICPACDRQVNMLYLPLLSLGLALTSPPALASRIENLKSQVRNPPPIFACARCHRVQFVSLGEPRRWNQFIRYLTAGLLYGREVPRPQWLPIIRKRRYAPQLNRQAPRRQQVLCRILAGQPIPQIAAELAITPQTVRGHLLALCCQERCDDRWALARKLGGNPQPASPRQHRSLLLQQLQALLLEGLSYNQIASRLSISPSTAANRLQQLYRLHGVSGRRARANLAAKLGTPLAASSFEPLRHRIATLRASGLPRRKIAATLNISPGALAYHIKHINREARFQNLPPPSTAAPVPSTAAPGEGQG